MTEVEKMYENAGIEPSHYDACKIADSYWLNEELANEYGTFDNYMKLNCIYHYQECTDECRHAYDRDTYPPFTAEKQIELIKKLGNINIDIDNGVYMSSEILEVEAHCDDFEETLAEFVINLWQDLTESEQDQIKEILK